MCRHHRIVGNRRGSRFYLCELAKTDPGFKRYPPLPVVRCSGYERGAPDPWEALRDDPTSEDPASNAFSGDVENNE